MAGELWSVNCNRPPITNHRPHPSGTGRARETQRLLPEGSNAETEQRWNGRERRKGKFQQRSAQLELSRKEQRQQQCAKRFRFVPIGQQPERFQLIGSAERTTRDRSWYDVARLDSGGSRFPDGGS